MEITNTLWQETIEKGCKQALEKIELTIDMTLAEAVEKQVPKKPYKTKEPISRKQNDYYCSVCKRYLGDDMELKHACLQPEYCQHCGQALDWSEIEIV